MTFAWRGPDAWARVADAARYMSWKYEDMGAGPRVDRAPPAARDGRRDRGRAPLARDRRARPSRSRTASAPTPRRSATRGSFVFRGHFPGLDPSVQREAFDVLVEEVVPLLRG